MPPITSALLLLIIVLLCILYSGFDYLSGHFEILVK